MQHLPLSVSRRCLSSLQAVNLQKAICLRMQAYAAWKDAAATISGLDPARFGHVEQEVSQQCAGLEGCPIDYMTALGWDGYGILVPRASFATAVSLRAHQLAVPPDPAGICPHSPHLIAMLC